MVLGDVEETVTTMDIDEETCEETQKVCLRLPPPFPCVPYGRVRSDLLRSHSVDVKSFLRFLLAERLIYLMML